VWRQRGPLKGGEWLSERGLRYEGTYGEKGMEQDNKPNPVFG